MEGLWISPVPVFRGGWGSGGEGAGGGRGCLKRAWKRGEVDGSGEGGRACTTPPPAPHKTVKYGRKSWGGESERVRRMRGKRLRGEWVKKKK